ncbi:Glu/Leu/Phe/Val dehydrogenase [Marivibrio halodurans]|uniref:Glu/Leu/Phe/Val dehydrogenase n=1 Tax=Marivibrio halodurans TaxID=2039722 RepID=A0A8J7SMQ8_9PROT|nr:Glu/Leu/Phe/Val dehydrogenase [Marivibrio halodurans]MBP5857553.1 Glu/Leu/Phe/Val dehydrogenase [Marivibrio halodurans]
MTLFTSEHFDDHEQVVFASDATTGLKAIIAIHNTNRGPALGGCRMWAYDSEEAAIADVLRLSRGMTYKNALANLPWGGGKSVIIADAVSDKTPAMMEAMGVAVERLNGRYIVAEDVGTTPEDMVEIDKATDHVRGVKGKGFDPSPATAYGCFAGIKASVKERLGRSDLEGIRVAVQGLGHVGYDLAHQLREAGADLVVADLNENAIAKARNELGAKVVARDAIHAEDVDVFAPCALGAVINDETVGALKAKIVAGSANNQLAADRHGQALADRGILYAPDYVINAGGVIHIYHEGPNYDKQRAFAHVGEIADTLAEIYDRAAKAKVPTHVAADRLAEERFGKRA